MYESGSTAVLSVPKTVSVTILSTLFHNQTRTIGCATVRIGLTELIAVVVYSNHVHCWVSIYGSLFNECWPKCYGSPIGLAEVAVTKISRAWRSWMCRS